MKTSLQTAIFKQIGVSKTEFKKNVSDYQNAKNGISGFCYYNDTHKFALKHQNAIVELLEEQADDLGEEVLDMVLNFGVFRNGIDKEEKKDIYKYLSGAKKGYETNSVLNVMAWFAVEQLAFELDN